MFQIGSVYNIKLPEGLRPFLVVLAVSREQFTAGAIIYISECEAGVTLSDKNLFPFLKNTS